MWGDFDKKLKIISLSICGLVLLVMAVGMLVIWIGSQDADPPELGHLTMEKREVADEDNALTYIEKALAAVVDSKSGWDFEVGMYWDLRKWRSGSREIEYELLRDIMQSNDAVFAWLERAAACENFVAPPRVEPTQRGWDYSGWLKLRELVRIKASWEARHGRYDEAADMLIHDCRLAQLVHSKSFDKLYLLVGYAHDQYAAEGMIHLAKMEGVPVATIRRMIHLLGESTDPELFFNQAIIGEYHQICEALDRMLTTDEGKAELINNFGSPDSPDWLEFTEGWFIEYRFHPNRTKQIIADRYQKYASELPATYHDALKAGWVVKKSHAEPGWRDKLKPNSLGPLVAAERTLGRHALFKYYESKFTRDATLVALAAIAYRKQHGEFPADLSDLVGEGLKEAPTDPFDGKPMRYDTTGYRIYTVGPDGVDDPTHRASQRIELLDWKKVEVVDEPPQGIILE